MGPQQKVTRKLQPFPFTRGGINLHIIFTSSITYIDEDLLISNGDSVCNVACSAWAFSSLL